MRSGGLLRRLAALHGGEESHDLILVHDHSADGVDDLKVFQLGFLVVQLVKLLLNICCLAFELGNVRSDLLLFSIHRNISFLIIVRSSEGVEMRLPIGSVDG